MRALPWPARRRALRPGRQALRAAAVGSLAVTLGWVLVGAWFPDPAIVVVSAGYAALALGWSGRAAWGAAAAGAAYLVVFWLLATPDSWVAALMFTLPSYAAGTVLRLRQETAVQLARRMRELEEERELYAAIALRHERARIAGELHDIVGHAVSVMVIQAAAGQRLVDSDPERARETFAAIAGSARQGSADLERLVALLAHPDAEPLTDLRLVEQVVARARESGLGVSCRIDGTPADLDRIAGPSARLAFRVVQESLTNALRHAPGAEVRIRVTVEPAALLVRVENDPAQTDGPGLVGTGRGLVGLRERVQALGGRLAAGATGEGGWAVEVHLPG